MAERRVHQPTTYCRIRTGEAPDKAAGRSAPVRLDHGIVEIRDGADWRPHPDFSSKGQQSFEIELLFNHPEASFQSHLSVWDGKRAFCTRAHRGMDEIGIALRRGADGALVKVECNPSLCALRKQAANLGGQEDVIKNEYQQLYPWAELFKINNSGKIQCAKCQAQNFFVFGLVHPTDPTRFAHADGEVTLYASHSDVNHGRIYDKLNFLYARCHGKLQGLRLFLTYQPFTNAMNQNIPAWNLVLKEELLETQRLEAAKRRALLAADYDEVVRNADSTAIMRLQAPVEAAIALGLDKSAADFAGLADAIDLTKINAEKIDPAAVKLLSQDAFVVRMCDRLDISYELRNSLNLHFKDAYRCMKWLEKVSLEGDAKRGIKPAYCTDILTEWAATLPQAKAAAAPKELPPPPPVTGTEPPPADEAEFTEVDDAELFAGVRGKG